ncbi:hypothetical protein BDV96DRAFT_579458 [Lophiotrema nucula]|uniref:C2H2-type domain-containing protein n=1 Tax=Lophiotrema nucula TaxID=690887 RepID=A0A6A5Z0K3_9PLEO|nr:hypothetical protein BDV96DRAFT_579458 [Lophiotrema nucula]
MAIQQRQQTASIYLTFKVVQFVNHFRRGLKPRVSDATTPSLGPDTCLGLSSQALRRIEKGLSRAELQNRKKHDSSSRICKNRNTIRPSLKLHTPGRHDAINRNTSGEEVQHLLQSLDGNIPLPNNALSATAADDGLFLKQDDLSITLFESFSINEITKTLALVFEALQVFNAVKRQYDDAWLVAQGQQSGLQIDEKFIANYEHLLLRLQSLLMESLTRKAIEALLEGGQSKTQRKLLGWFAEFPSVHPKCATWPWSVSSGLLAVLWGVCWMYYSPTDEQGAGKGSNRVPQDRFLQNQAWSLPRPSSNEYFNFGRELTGTQPQQASQQPHHDVGGFRQDVAGAQGFRAAQSGFESLQGAMYGGPHVMAGSRLRLSGRNSADRRQDHGLAVGRAFSASPTTATATYNNAASWSHDVSIIAAQDTNFFSPDFPGLATSHNILAFPQQFDNSIPQDSSWQQYAHTQRHSVSGLPQQDRSSHLAVPGITIRVTDGNPGSNGSAQPQPDFGSYSNSLYQSSAQQPQAPQLNIDTSFSHFYQDFDNMGNLANDASPLQIHSAPVSRHERTPSLNSTIPTPVSMTAPRSPVLSPASDRRLSVASSHAHGGHQRQISEDISSIDGDDTLGPRRNHAYKRSEEPPRNRENKMICKHEECASLTFDRKCEWSKHMDKHDRPYKCNVKGCEKLQGFTYSGGLLRHEREVHKLHGGTKKSLYCPFPDCKRSSGSGFTRKENLAEHVRRVHRRAGSTSTDLGTFILTRSDTELEATEVRLPSESPYQRNDEIDLSSPLKRKRTSDAGSEDGGDSDLRAELKRLRRENEEKDSRLRQLEAAVMALQSRG